MTGRPIRFIHASDFHLEQPVFGLAEVPDHLRSLLLEAPYQAAARVFDAVLSEAADFLVLSGDLLELEAAGPRGALFLIEQFRRLAERHIPVYWAIGPAEASSDWLDNFPWPDNVHLLAEHTVQELSYPSGGRTLVHILGRGYSGRERLRNGDFACEPERAPTIAVAYGAVDATDVVKSNVAYWALGGQHARSTWPSATHTIHYPGTPQGRQRSEAGGHGCTLVHLDETGQARLQSIETAVLHWRTETLEVGLATHSHDLLEMVRQRLRSLAADAPNVAHLVDCQIIGMGPLVGQLRRGGLAVDLLGRLHAEFGFATPPLWTVALESGATALPEAWTEQETILGDFLRAVKQFEHDPDLSLGLENYLPPQHRADALGSALANLDPARRGRVLQQAASLGADLLSGEEVSS